MKRIESDYIEVKINPMEMFKDDQDLLDGLKAMHQFAQKLKKRDGRLRETIRKDLDAKEKAELSLALNKMILFLESVDAEYH